MNITVQRLHPFTVCTVGTFSVDGKSWFSMELPITFDGQENVPDKTCIPAATYQVQNLFSEKHGRLMPHVMGVQDRTAIELHAASRPMDLLGCTAIGENWYNQNPQNVADVVINNSQLAFADFQQMFENALANGEDVSIQFLNDF